MLYTYYIASSPLKYGGIGLLNLLRTRGATTCFTWLMITAVLIVLAVLLVMASKLPPPSSFDFAHPEKWSDWIRRFDRYLLASLLTKEEELTQVNCLLYTMGEEAESIFPTLKLTDANRKKLAPVKKAFEEYFSPKQNPVHWRCILRQRSQQDNETVETYLRALYNIADKCDYSTDIKNEEVRDQFVIDNWYQRQRN